jgi:hypothetical protein
MIEQSDPNEAGDQLFMYTDEVTEDHNQFLEKNHFIVHLQPDGDSRGITGKC